MLVPARYYLGATGMLPTWVSSCEIDGQTIFLDVRSNRYLRLTAATGRAVIRGEFETLHPNLQNRLRSLGWSGETRAPAHSRSRPRINAAREQSAEYVLGAPTRRQLASALFSLLAARIALSICSFDLLLCKVERNNRFAKRNPGSPAERSDLIAAFEYVERTMVGKDRCLLRAIALQRLLAGGGHASTLVFGVRLNPFHAHCWLQDGDLVLNDTIEVIASFQPIRAVG